MKEFDKTLKNNRTPYYMECGCFSYVFSLTGQITLSIACHQKKLNVGDGLFSYIYGFEAAQQEL